MLLTLNTTAGVPTTSCPTSTGYSSSGRKQFAWTTRTPAPTTTHKNGTFSSYSQRISTTSSAVPTPSTAAVAAPSSTRSHYCHCCTDWWRGGCHLSILPEQCHPNNNAEDGLKCLDLGACYLPPGVLLPHPLVVSTQHSVIQLYYN